jgi:sugar phosphate isomerase/epimerase
VFVSCSTLCFAGRPFDAALRQIFELEFNKIDLAVHEGGPHLRPSVVAENPEAAVLALRSGPSLNVSSLDLDLGEGLDAATFRRRFQAMCRFAKGLTVAVLSLPAAPLGTPMEAEVARLSGLVELAGGEGLVLTVPTHSATLTSTPAAAVALCEAVPGLGLTLDPSHYINGPHQGQLFDEVLPFAQNVHFRDTGRKPGEFQVRVGQGEVEYGRVVNLLERTGYDRSLTVAIHDRPDNTFDVELEVRKLKLLLESLL